MLLAKVPLTDMLLDVSAPSYCTHTAPPPPVAAVFPEKKPRMLTCAMDADCENRIETAPPRGEELSEHDCGAMTTEQLLSALLLLVLLLLLKAMLMAPPLFPDAELPENTSTFNRDTRWGGGGGVGEFDV